MTVTEAPVRRRSARQPIPIGGWLILVAIGLVIAPIRIAVASVQTYVPLFTDGSWQLLTTPGTGTYHRLWAPVLLGELAANVGFFVAFLVLLLAFVMRSRNFPRLYIWVLALNVAFILVDSLLLDALAAAGTGNDAIYKPLLLGLLSASIWIPYMLRSQRVRNTFVT